MEVNIGVLVAKLAVATLLAVASWGTYKIYAIIRDGTILKRVLKQMATPDRHRTITRWIEESGPNVHMRMAWWNVLVVTEPALVAEVLHNPKMDKVEEVYDGIRPMMSDAGHPDLVTSYTDESWRLVRKGVAPAFSPHNIRKGFRHAAACGDQLVAVLKAKARGGEPVDIDHACLCETMDMIGLFGFGHHFNALGLFGEDKHAKMMDVMIKAELEVQRRLEDPTRRWVAPFTKDGREAFAYFKQFHSITRELLAEMKAREEGPAEEDGSIGGHLLRIRDAAGRKLPDEQLLPHIGMFFFAGFDTTGHTMAWTLFLLSQHPEAEARVAAELRGLGLLATPEQPEPRALEYDDLGKLTYLSYAIKESMRLKPVVASGTVRMAKEDTTLGAGKYRVPANTVIWTPAHTIHTSHYNWGSDAGSYKPERWLEPGVEYAAPAGGSQQRSAGVGNTAAAGIAGTQPSREPSASESFELGIKRDYKVGLPDAARTKRFLPFSDGKRDCVGQAMARMNYTSTLARLLATFRFELAPEMGGAVAVEAEETMAMTLQPGPKGILMRCIPRAVA